MKMSNTPRKANWASVMRSNISTWILRVTLISSVVLNMYFLLADPTSRDFFIKPPFAAAAINGSLEIKDGLTELLQDTATPEKTIILTYLNEAWIAPNSMFDLFLKSFQNGINTRWLVNHLVVVSLDEKAHSHCLKIHSHCYHYKVNQFNFTMEASYMSSNYLELVWRKVEFMHTVLEKGYNFLFTDADIMWFRDPFPHLSNDSHFQVSCDKFYGDITSMRNLPNTGLMYVKTDIHTRLFFKIWYLLRYNYSGKKTQDVFNIMKKGELFNIIGLKVRFLEPKYFSGFCDQGKNFSEICTMHGNCCIGLAPKVHDLGLILNDWSNYMSSSSEKKNSSSWKWSAPKICRSKL